MNTVVRKQILAGELPADLRGDLGPEERVEVVVSRVSDHDAAALERARKMIEDYEKSSAGRTVTIDEILAKLPVGPGITIDEAVARVRLLRDEWDDP
jgi:hypothetical protein